jgi:uncharacterized protein (DUF302 family)
MTTAQRAYGLRTAVNLPFATAVEKTRAALQEEGFGILTEIDVQATMKQKMNIEYRPYLILGACNPALAHRALQAEPEIGLLLPCNVIVYEEGDQSIVEAMDPEAALGIAQSRALDALAHDAKERLRRAVDAVSAAAATV